MESVSGCRKRLEQIVRYRLSLSARRLHEVGAERATSVLHRRVGRLLQRTDELERCAYDQLQRSLRTRYEMWRTLDARLRRMDLRLRFSEARRRIDALHTDACRVMRLRLSRAHSAWSPAQARLEQLSPVKILERGYAIVQDASGRVIKASSDAPTGTRIRARLAHGQLSAVVSPPEE
jgi:exodeoxyribonuclease VII large subunit